MQTIWHGHHRGVVQSTFRKWRLQNRPPVSTVPAVVVASRSIVTPIQCLKSETSSSLPSCWRSTSSHLDHQSTTDPTTPLFSLAAKKQHSVSRFHTLSCQLAPSRKGIGIFLALCLAESEWDYFACPRALSYYLTYVLVGTGDLIGREEAINVGRAMATLAAQSHVDLVLSVDNINPNVKAMEYAVRG